ICCATSKGNVIALPVAKIEGQIREGGRSRSGRAAVRGRAPPHNTGFAKNPQTQRNLTKTPGETRDTPPYQQHTPKPHPAPLQPLKKKNPTCNIFKKKKKNATKYNYLLYKSDEAE
ncbi:hypothetical protein, partial [Enterobacter hormaechei]